MCPTCRPRLTKVDEPVALTITCMSYSTTIGMLGDLRVCNWRNEHGNTGLRAIRKFSSNACKNAHSSSEDCEFPLSRMKATRRAPRRNVKDRRKCGLARALTAFRGNIVPYLHLDKSQSCRQVPCGIDRVFKNKRSLRLAVNWHAERCGMPCSLTDEVIDLPSDVRAGAPYKPSEYSRNGSRRCFRYDTHTMR
jgi:hypothetical protein